MRELLAYRDLVRELVSRDLRVRYRRTVLGFFWTFLQPLAMMLVLQIAFSSIFRFNLDDYPAYVFSGLLFWGFLSQSITASMNSLRTYAHLLQTFPVPAAVFPLVTVLSGLVNLGFSAVGMLLILAGIGHPLRPAILFLPVAVLIAAVFTLGLGLILSPLAVFFHDLVEMVGVALQLLFFLTPVMYPMSIVPPRWLWVVRLNPVRSVLEVFRDPIYFGKVPPLAHVAVASALALLSLTVGVVAFRRSARRIPYYL